MKTISTNNTYQEAITRWKQEDILQLAHHFHRMDTENDQFERMHNFVMNEEDVATLESNKDKLTKLKIHLALSERNKAEITFFPVIEAHFSDNNKKFMKLNAVAERTVDPSESELVPKLFKDMIAKNWDELEFHLLDDLFTARKKQENGSYVTVRVQHFKICDEMIEQVIKKLSKIKGITFYSGVDMNKFSNNELISFTPTVGFAYEETTASNYSIGLQSMLEFSKEKEVFIEYSSPCPPTC